jgi:NADH-quinone oxidoreductase subunit G
VHEGKQPVDDNSVMSFSMEGMLTQKDSSLLATAWAPRWNSNQSISKFQAEVNGELKQGHPGVHLIASSSKGLPYNTEQSIGMDAPFEIRFVRQIFGSDSLSSHSAAIQKRMCDAYLSLCPNDAREMGLVNGDLVSIEVNEESSTEGGATLPLFIRKETPQGVALVYAGSSAIGVRINPHDLPQYASLAPSRNVYEAVQARLGLLNLVVNDAAAGAH